MVRQTCPGSHDERWSAVLPHDLRSAPDQPRSRFELMMKVDLVQVFLCQLVEFLEKERLDLSSLCLYWAQRYLRLNSILGQNPSLRPAVPVDYNSGITTNQMSGRTSSDLRAFLIREEKRSTVLKTRRWRSALCEWVCSLWFGMVISMTGSATHLHLNAASNPGKSGLAIRFSPLATGFSILVTHFFILVMDSLSPTTPHLIPSGFARSRGPNSDRPSLGSSIGWSCLNRRLGSVMNDRSTIKPRHRHVLHCRSRLLCRRDHRRLPR